MASPNLFILYVANPEASIAFYRARLGIDPMVASPNFASFALPGGFALGLWGTSKVVPPPAETGARTELAFMVESRAVIEAMLQDWKAQDVAIEQELTTTDFGPTFVALDPDGHRLRVCLFDE